MTPGLDQLESRQLLSTGFQVETNATTAAPAVTVAKTSGSVSGTVGTTTAATKPASSDSGVVPNAVAVSPAVVTNIGGTLEDSFSTLGTKEHGLTS
jgi:hypothetical protein